MHYLSRTIAITIIAGIKIIRPLLGPGHCCRHFETCSAYAKRHLLTTPLYKAIPKIIIRVLSCNPLTTRNLSQKDTHQDQGSPNDHKNHPH